MKISKLKQENGRERERDEAQRFFFEGTPLEIWQHFAPFGFRNDEQIMVDAPVIRTIICRRSGYFPRKVKI